MFAVGVEVWTVVGQTNMTKETQDSAKPLLEDEIRNLAIARLRSAIGALVEKRHADAVQKLRAVLHDVERLAESE